MEGLLTSLSDNQLRRLKRFARQSEDVEALGRIKSRIDGFAASPEPLHPRQREFLALDCEEAMFGGAVGGGKSEALLAWLREGVRHANFSGLFLRRTFAQLRGSPTTPIERSWKFFRPLGGVFNATEKYWKFANGAMIRFGHMQHEDDKHNYDGPEFHRICVERRTPIKMADGQWKPLCRLSVGEEVLTLEGSRPIRKIWQVGRKPVVRASTRHGASLISDSHRMLTSVGWVSPSEQRSILCQILLTSLANFLTTYSGCGRLCARTHSDRQPVWLGAAVALVQAAPLCLGAWLANDRNGFAASCDAPLATAPLGEWYVHGVLHGLAPRLTESSYDRESHRHALSCVSGECGALDSRGDYPVCSDFRDAQSHQSQASGQARIPLLAAAGLRSLADLRADDRENIPAHSLGRIELNHPYTTRRLDICEDVHLGPVHMARAGEAELMDLTVEGASHYLVFGNIPVSNCFDQVEQFSETQYEYMFSRLRRTVDFDLPCGIRSAANPVGASWVKRRFVTEEAIETLKGYTAHDPSPPGMQFVAENGAVFLPSRIADNPSLQVDEYIERLRAKLGAVLAARLANGDWSVVEGALIDPGWLRYYSVQGRLLRPLAATREGLGPVIDSAQCQRFATVDTAGTSKQKAAEDKGKPPSWSVCAIWDYWSEARFLFLRHVWRDRVDWNALKTDVRAVLAEWQVKRILIENAHFGQPLAEELAGLGNIQLVGPMVAGMQTARSGDVKSAKQERAIASGFLTAIENAELYLPDVGTVPGAAKWMPECESELLGWTGRPDETADQIDVFSYAVDHVGRNRLSWGGVIR